MQTVSLGSSVFCVQAGPAVQFRVAFVASPGCLAGTDSGRSLTAENVPARARDYYEGNTLYLVPTPMPGWPALPRPEEMKKGKGC